MCQPKYKPPLFFFFVLCLIELILRRRELSDLRNSSYNNASSFARVHRVHCVRGSYPNRLLTQWDLFDQLQGSENDYPNFNSDQLYIVLELEHGGKDLEAFEFSNAEKSYALFFQVIFILKLLCMCRVLLFKFLRAFLFIIFLTDG